MYWNNYGIKRYIINGEKFSLKQAVVDGGTVFLEAFSMKSAVKGFKGSFSKSFDTFEGGTSSTSFDYYMDLVENLDVSTKPNTATFYSGPGNRALAENFARANGKTTLEMTTGGEYLDSLKLFANNSPLKKEEATIVGIIL